MGILGIGLPELVLIFLLAIIIFGPNDLEKVGKSVGRWLYQFVHSDTWKTLAQASHQLQHLPTDLMRQAGLDEIDLKKTIDPRSPATSQLEAAKPTSIEFETITSPPAPGQDPSD